MDASNGNGSKAKKKVKKPQPPPASTISFFFALWWIVLLIALTAGVGFSIAYLSGYTVFADEYYFEDRIADRKSLEIGSGALKLMWATPIFTINLHNNSRITGNAFNTSDLNKGLHKAVLTEFEKFLHEVETKNGEGTSKSGSSSRAYNEMFFAWQRDSWEKNGRTAMDKYPEFVHLKAIMKSAATTFLDMTGRVMPERTEMFSWATIHRECMFHLAHTHPHNLVSGVYYARIPKDAGDIIFDDPRGPLPPFENRIIHTPTEGDLIVFPSWLLHQVSPTLGDEERISFSFNIPGDWTQTADVSLTIPFM